jgi:TIR domain-containing protein
MRCVRARSIRALDGYISMSNMLTKIFISYGREDIESARRLYAELKAVGLDPWLDKESLVAGQKWKSAIRKSIRESRYFLALLSTSSVSRKGFVNKELSDALEVLEEYPESEIFLIPVRLDNCHPSHEKLSELHFVDMFPSWDEGMRRIKKAIKLTNQENLPVAQLFLKTQKLLNQSTIDSIYSISGVEAIYAVFGDQDCMIVVRGDNPEQIGVCRKIVEKLPEVESVSGELAIRIWGSSER